jgi:EAL domain-containing protein (putative c-di-GMP-specific phosphodiesterase class I)
MAQVRRAPCTPGRSCAAVRSEITEHVVVEDYAALQAGIKALGPDARMAVDDAGSGYAILRHILELKPDFVKLDLGLVREINRDQARQASSPASATSPSSARSV